MKKTLSLILAMLMCISAFTLVACGGEDGTKPSTTAPGSTENSSPAPQKPSPDKPNKPTPDKPLSDDDGKTPADLLHPLTATQKHPFVEHVVKEDLPSSFTLVGTDELPRIENQGSVGSCAAESIAYLQFTNAAIRYEHSINPNSKWTAKEFKDCFSPKFGYQYAGPVTQGVYDLLIDHGCLKMGLDSYAKLPGGHSYVVKPDGKYEQQSTKWLTSQGIGETAMEYRLLRYEHYGLNDKSSGCSDPSKGGIALTTSEGGLKMLQKVKDALVCGNVVVTAGLADTWRISKVKKNTGSLGKIGDGVITHAISEGTGGHQISIVGYDDEFTVKAGGVEMKGAFIIANSWGENWEKANGKGGYVWCMYDAINAVSEYEDFEMPNGEKRGPAFSQFDFIYWDRDIVRGMPDLYAEVEIESTNRESFKMELSRIDKDGNDITTIPALYFYQTNHPDYGLKKDQYFNIDGILNGEKATGFHTVSFQKLLNNLPAGTDFTDYRWGIKINNNSDEFPISIKSITIKNSKMEVLKKFTFNVPEVQGHATRTYTFDLKDEKAGYNLPEGEVILKNVATGKYLAKNRPVDFKVDVEKKAIELKLNYDYKENKFVVLRKDEKYVLDVKDTVTSGALAVFAPKRDDKAATQFWNIARNEDGSFTFYITTAKGTNYALGVNDDGIVVMMKATELNDKMKWFIETDELRISATTVKATENGIEIFGVSASKSYKGVNIEAVNIETGEVVKTSATIEDMKFTAKMELGKGTYLVKFLRDTNETTSVSSFCIITLS